MIVTCYLIVAFVGPLVVIETGQVKFVVVH